MGSSAGKELVFWQDKLRKHKARARAVDELSVTGNVLDAAMFSDPGLGRGLSTQVQVHPAGCPPGEWWQPAVPLLGREVTVKSGDKAERSMQEWINVRVKCMRTHLADIDT